MRISDWSSDVCSSDLSSGDERRLNASVRARARRAGSLPIRGAPARRPGDGVIELAPVLYICGLLLVTLAVAMLLPALVDFAVGHEDWRIFVASRSAERRVGKEFCRKCSTRWWALH